jgi:hypothetical protein
MHPFAIETMAAVGAGVLSVMVVPVLALKLPLIIALLEIPLLWIFARLVGHLIADVETAAAEDGYTRTDLLDWLFNPRLVDMICFLAFAAMATFLAIRLKRSVK